MINKLCPFRKKFQANYDTEEEFAECIGEKCAAYYVAKKYNGYGVPTEISHKCSLLNNELLKENI